MYDLGLAKPGAGDKAQFLEGLGIVEIVLVETIFADDEQQLALVGDGDHIGGGPSGEVFDLAFVKQEGCFDIENLEAVFALAEEEVVVADGQAVGIVQWETFDQVDVANIADVDQGELVEGTADSEGTRA